MIEVFCINQTELQSVKQKYFNVKKFIYFLIVFNTFEYIVTDNAAWLKGVEKILMAYAKLSTYDECVEFLKAL